MGTVDDFIEEYKPITNPLNPSGIFNGCFYETYGEEFNLVSEAFDTPRKIWTLVSCDDDTYIESGYHVVNRLGYFITEIPLPENVKFKIYDAN